MSLKSARPSLLPHRRQILAGLALAPLGACATGPGFKTSGADQTITEQPVLHVITTRKLAKEGKASPFLDAGRSPRLAYHRAQLKPPDRSTLGRIGAYVANGDFSVTALESQPGEATAAFAEGLRGRESLLFVHGYNQTFESAAYDAAVLGDGIGFRGNVALFTWPSRAGLLDYGYDRESALIARDPFADALAAVTQDPFGARVHLVAHSMGTLVALEALRMHRDRHGDKGLDRLGAIVFAAPDIDADVFRAGLEKLGPLREKMTVITATNDRALDLSRRLAGGDRVGALPAKALDGLGIRVIDATDFASGLIRHDVFVSNADVRAAIQRAVQRA
ncbi:MAG: alpha/beta hydrolase [Rhabdaerophilum sp.]